MPKLEFQGDMFNQHCPKGATNITLSYSQDCVYCFIKWVAFHGETTGIISNRSTRFLELTTRNKLAPSRLSPESVGVAKSFKVDTDTDVEVSKDELENIALESNRTIDINEFVPKADPRYLILTVLSPAGWQVGHDAFAVIRETIRRSY
jgi:hypothetical protein